MTRWARAGNSQRHQKIPGEATKWGEFDLQKSERRSPSKNTKNTELLSKSNVSDFSKRKHFKKMKKNKNKKNSSHIEMSEDDDQSHNKIQNNASSSTSEAYLDHSQKETKNAESSHPQQNTSVEKVLTKKGKQDKQNDVHNRNTETFSKIFENKKSRYLEKLQKKRAKNGILLLPVKVERKLYNIKRRLREKNLPASVIVEIIRKERRKEELNFRKTIAPSKVCFNCRQPGHILADCPEKLGSSNQETGICFKCGSKEHTSFKCPEKIKGFPFAKCFICKEKGHITKECPNNKHGVYPKGGRCNLCGNVNHLKRDCPTLSKKVDCESTVTLQMLDGISSIDAEVPEKTQLKKQNVKKPKIVKF